MSLLVPTPLAIPPAAPDPAAPPTTLALDLGTQTGWALCGRDWHITSGSESFRPQRFEGGGMRYLRFRRWLTELKATTDVSARRTHVDAEWR